MGRRIAYIALGLAFCCGANGAAAQDDEVQQVPVNGVKNPEMKSYRAVWAGLEMFDRQHDLAPAVPELRFRIQTHSRGKGEAGYAGKFHVQFSAAGPAPESDYALRIAADDLSIPVAVSPEGLFSVPRSEAAYDAKADLILNRKKGSYRITPEVRTPGLPDNVRRLGDLRLECKVQVAIAKEEISFWIVALANSVLLSTDWCMTTKANVNFSYQTEKPLLSAALTHEARSQTLEFRPRSYKVPLGDRSWPDDTLIRLEYAPE
jgi:hypothetical protein